MRFLIGALLVLAVGNARADPLPQAAVDRALTELDFQLGGVGPLPPSTGTSERDQAARVRAFVRDRVRQPRFTYFLATKLFRVLEDWRASNSLAPTAYFLQSKVVDAQRVYYLDEPCAPTSAVPVSPWWNLPTTVLVCPDSYRPEVKVDQSLPSPRRCDAPNLPKGPARTCGCGEHLLGCAKDQEQAWALFAAERAEPIYTLRHIITNGLPFSKVATLEGSVRSELGDFFYARSAYYTTGKLDMKPNPGNAPSDYVYRPREAIYQAGLLSTPYWLYYDQARRAVIANVWDDFMCAPFVSARVATHDLFTIDSASFRLGEHLDLSEKVGCRNCHARLEYAIRAFRAFNGFLAHHFEPNLISTDETRFYVRDHTDLRATGPATPAWIGETIGKQPEFTRCMVAKTEEYLFQGFPIAPEAHAFALRRFQQDQNMALLLEDIAVAYVLGAGALLASSP